MLLRTSLPFLLFWKQVQVQAGNRASEGCQGLPPHSVIDVILYLVLALSLVELPHIENPQKFPWPSQTVCANGVAVNIFMHISDGPAQVSWFH